MKPTAVITGATGLIGNALAAALAANFDVVELGRRSSSRERRHIAWDFRREAPGQLPVAAELVVHAAATDGRNSEGSALVGEELVRECCEINTHATARLLEYAKRASARCFVYFSTGSVYPLAGAPIREQDRIAPEGPYAESKAAAESLVRDYSNTFNTLCLRLFHPYGPGQRLPRLIPGIVQRIRSGAAVPLHGESGRPAINPVYVDDVTAWTARLIASGTEGLFNLAGPETVTIRQLSDRIGELLFQKVTYAVGPAAAGDRIGAIDAVIAATGYRPQFNLRDGLERSGLLA